MFYRWISKWFRNRIVQELVYTKQLRSMICLRFRSRQIGQNPRPLSGSRASSVSPWTCAETAAAPGKARPTLASHPPWNCSRCTNLGQGREVEVDVFDQKGRFLFDELGELKGGHDDSVMFQLVSTFASTPKSPSVFLFFSIHLTSAG